MVLTPTSGLSSFLALGDPTSRGCMLHGAQLTRLPTAWMLPTPALHAYAGHPDPYLLPPICTAFPVVVLYCVGVIVATGGGSWSPETLGTVVVRAMRGAMPK